jgi:hypothetical protein
MAMLCIGAPTAAAKSGIDVSAVWNGGGTGVAVSAFGGDDAAGPQRLCLQESTRQGWHTLVCGRIELGTGGKIGYTVPAAGPGARFRAVLQRISRMRGRAPQADLTSAGIAPKTPSARSLSLRSARAAALRHGHGCDRPEDRAQRQAKSRSVVSLSSVDNGIATASVVRSK